MVLDILCWKDPPSVSAAHPWKAMTLFLMPLHEDRFLGRPRLEIVGGEGETEAEAVEHLRKKIQEMLKPFDGVKIVQIEV